MAKLTKDSADVVAFQEEVVNRTWTKWSQCGSAEEKWIVMKSALTEAAEAVWELSLDTNLTGLNRVESCSRLSNIETNFTNNGLPPKVQQIYRGFGKPE